MTNKNEDGIQSAIDNAVEVVDPLEGLVKRATDDPGTVFEVDVLDGLSELKKDDFAAFEKLRAQLKKVGCRVTELDKAITKMDAGSDGRNSSQSDVLVNLASSADLFHAPDGNSFADIDINDHRETWPVRSKVFKGWLTRQYYEETGRAANSEALQSTLNLVEAKAQFDAQERSVFVRIGGLDGKIYVDLCDEKWQVIEIDENGWRVIDAPPIRFRRTSGMQPLPMPLRGGSIDTLRSFLNVKSDDDFVLVVAWLLAALRDHGPYPVMVLSGEQGSAKSTFSKILRGLLDPKIAPLRALPREERDLFIAANNGHLLVFDNVSGLPHWTSDTLCRLATGGGFAVRQLYTDQDEVLFDATRPLILNGIEDMVARPDLADRAIILTLEPIPEERRRPEAELLAAFDAERARILAALLDAVVHGLKMLPETSLEKHPRMADFAFWSTACETAFWPAGTFWKAYGGNRDEAVEDVIGSDPVASAVRTVVERTERTVQTVWTGTATELLDTLAEVTADGVRKSKAWPKSPRALSGELRRVATFLRQIGIEINYTKEGRARTRIIHITATDTSTDPDNTGIGPSAPSAPSANFEKTACNNGLGDTVSQTVPWAADANIGVPKASTVRENPCDSAATDGADGADANITPESGPKEASGPGWGTRI